MRGMGKYYSNSITAQIPKAFRREGLILVHFHHMCDGVSCL